jgi:RNA polymerase sigma-70 factor (ECF subfamily)
MTWACAIARYQVLAYLKRESRDRLHFDEDLVKKLADQAVSHAEQMESRRRALQGCVEKLPDNDRELIQSRYSPEGSVRQLANATDRSVGAISQALYRIRQALHRCIETKLAIQD